MTDLLERLSNGVTDSDSINTINELLVDCYNEISDLRDKAKVKDRTQTQSNSRWLYLEMLATQLNEAGYDRVAVIEKLKSKPTVDVGNTKESLYELYWRGVQKAVYPEVIRLDKKQIQKVYETMNRHTADVFGVSIPWPDKYGQEYEKGR